MFKIILPCKVGGHQRDGFSKGAEYAHGLLQKGASPSILVIACSYTLRHEYVK